MRLPFSSAFNLLRRPAHPLALLVVDVGTLFVHIAMFAADGDHPSAMALKGHARVARGGGGMHADFLIDAQSITATVQEAVERVKSSTGIVPKRLRIAAGGGMLFGRTVRQQYRREDSKTTIDERELLHILQKIEWHAFEEIRKEFTKETGRHDTDVGVVTSRATRVTVDGYAVESPLGFRGQSVAMDVFHVYAPESHLQALQSMAQAIGIEEWEIVAEYDAVVRALTSHGIESALVFDIGGISTEITLVKDGSVVTTDRFAFGGQAMTQRIARHLKVENGEAEKIKQQYSSGSLSANAKRKITTLANPDLDVWEQGVMYALSTFARRHSPLPSQWFLHGGGALFPKFRERLTKRRWSEKLPFVQEPSIDFFPQDIIEKSGILRGAAEENFLALVSLYAAALVDRDSSKEREHLNHQLRRVLRIIQS